MIQRHIINKEQALAVIQNGEFGSEIITSKNAVIIVMTQDWCPQWARLKRWLYDMETQEDVDIYELEYNKEDYFDEFMRFKEGQWKNDQIPYLRYYKNGVLAGQTNYASEETIRNILGI